MRLFTRRQKSVHRGGLQLDARASDDSSFCFRCRLKFQHVCRAREHADGRRHDTLIAHEHRAVVFKHAARDRIARLTDVLKFQPARCKRLIERRVEVGRGRAIFIFFLCVGVWHLCLACRIFSIRVA